MKILKDIGERKLIEIIANMIHSNNSIEIGDDCAAIEMDDHYFLISTDIISEKTHIPSVMKPWDIGWFITAINLSDIAAKGGIPLGFLLSMGLKPDMKVDDFQAIIQGVEDCVSTFNASLIGGDTKEHESMVLSGTIVGMVKKNNFMARFGAKAGDVLAVTGSIGKAAAGYLLIQKKHNDDSINGLIHPYPRINEGIQLGKTTKVSCCMDLSDGLSSSLYQLSQKNNVGFSVNMDQLPISDHLSSIFKDSMSHSMYLDSVLHFGGDYELLFTCSPNDFSKLQCLFPKNFLHKIGIVTKKTDIVLLKNDEEIIIENKGYEHFRNHHLNNSFYKMSLF